MNRQCPIHDWVEQFDSKVCCGLHFIQFPSFLFSYKNVRNENVWNPSKMNSIYYNALMVFETEMMLMMMMLVFIFHSKNWDEEKKRQFQFYWLGRPTK